MFFSPLCPTNFPPFKKKWHAALRSEIEIRASFLYMQHSANLGTFSAFQESQRTCTLKNLCGNTWVWLSTFAQGNNFHAFASRSSPCRKSNNTILTFRPPLPTPKVEQTSNQPQEYLLKPELFSRTSVVKPRDAQNWMTGRSRTVISQPLILLWQAAVQNAYFRHRNRSKCPNYLFSKSFLLLHGGQKEHSINLKRYRD